MPGGNKNISWKECTEITDNTKKGIKRYMTHGDRKRANYWNQVPGKIHEKFYVARAGVLVLSVAR